MIYTGVILHCFIGIFNEINTVLMSRRDRF